MYYIVNIEGKYLCGRFSPDLWTYDLEKAIGFELEQDANEHQIRCFLHP